MIGLTRKSLFFSVIFAATLALSLAGSKASASSNSQARLKVDKTAGVDVASTCPLGVPDSKLAVQVTPEGLTLKLTAKPDRVQALRGRVAKLATRIKSQNATAEAMSTMSRSVMGPELGQVMEHMMWRMNNQRDWSQATIGEPVGPLRAASERSGTQGGMMASGMGNHGGMMGSGMGNQGGMMASGMRGHGAMMAGRIVPWSKIDTKDIPRGVEIRLSQPAAVEREELQAAVQRRTDRFASAAACRLASVLRPVSSSQQGGATVQ